jgi:glutathione S-transferase
MAAMARKYLSSEAEMAQAEDRVVEILRLLAAQLEQSKRAGHRYLMGAELTALDIYWATFCNLVKPLPPEKLPLAPGLAAMFEAKEPAIVAALDPALLAHRDLVYETHLELPVEM